MLVAATLLFVITTACVSLALIAGYTLLEPEATQWPRRAIKAIIAIDGWLLITGFLASGDFLGDFSRTPPPFVLVVIIAFTAMLGYVLPTLGARFALQTPLQQLIIFQSFRLPIAIGLELLVFRGVLPEQLSIRGWNWDLLIGISAIPLALWAARREPPKWLLLLWNSLGTLFAIVLFAIAFFALPFSFQLFQSEPSSMLLTNLPFVWLLSALLPTALFGHLLIFRYLWTKPQPSEA